MCSPLQEIFVAFIIIIEEVDLVFIIKQSIKLMVIPTIFIILIIKLNIVQY